MFDHLKALVTAAPLHPSSQVGGPPPLVKLGCGDPSCKLADCSPPTQNPSPQPLTRFRIEVDSGMTNLVRIPIPPEEDKFLRIAEHIGNRIFRPHEASILAEDQKDDDERPSQRDEEQDMIRGEDSVINTQNQQHRRPQPHDWHLEILNRVTRKVFGHDALLAPSGRRKKFTDVRWSDQDYRIVTGQPILGHHIEALGLAFQGYDVGDFDADEKVVLREDGGEVKASADLQEEDEDEFDLDANRVCSHCEYGVSELRIGKRGLRITFIDDTVYDLTAFSDPAASSIGSFVDRRLDGGSEEHDLPGDEHEDHPPRPPDEEDRLLSFEDLLADFDREPFLDGTRGSYLRELNTFFSVYPKAEKTAAVLKAQFCHDPLAKVEVAGVLLELLVQEAFELLGLTKSAPRSRGRLFAPSSSVATSFPNAAASPCVSAHALVIQHLLCQIESPLLRKMGLGYQNWKNQLDPSGESMTSAMNWLRESPLNAACLWVRGTPECPGERAAVPPRLVVSEAERVVVKIKEKLEEVRAEVSREAAAAAAEDHTAEELAEEFGVEKRKLTEVGGAKVLRLGEEEVKRLMTGGTLLLGSSEEEVKTETGVRFVGPADHFWKGGGGNDASGSTTLLEQAAVENVVAAQRDVKEVLQTEEKNSCVVEVGLDASSQ